MVKRGRVGYWVLLVLGALFIPAVYAANGCFTEPSFPDICTVIDENSALTFCGASQDAQACLQQHFFEGISCDDVTICSFHPGTWCGDTCQQVNRPAQCTDRAAWLNQTTTPIQCQTGCVVCDRDPSIATENVCRFGLNQIEAAALCRDLVGYHVGLFDTSFTSSQCTNTCAAFTSPPGTITGTIRDSSGVAIANARVSAFGKSNQTDAEGLYHLNNLPSGAVTITTSKESFQTSHTSTSLASGEQKQVDIVLSAAATGVIRGRVSDAASHVLGGVQVAVRGPSAGQAVTDDRGNYQLGGLPFGDYIVEADKVGFQGGLKSAAVSATSPLSLVDFTLSPVLEGVIMGQVTDAAGRPVPFAQIFVNGAFATHSALNGFYSARVHADGDGETYILSAAKVSFAPSISQQVTVATGETKTANFILASLVPECVFPVTKPIAVFAANHVPGEKAVQLVWQKPCPEVKGYTINRSIFQPGIGTGPSTQITFLDVVSGVVDPTSYIDRNVSWNTSYSYSISAVYADVQVRFSEKKTTTLVTGDSRCEGKRQTGEAVEFCVGNVLRKTCTSQNQVVDAGGADPADCSAMGATFFCAGPDVAGDTRCRDAGVCSSQAQGANPFGLWFSRNQCYGSFNTVANAFANFCTFDRSITIFDQCLSCARIESCFDYKGKDACTTNNCQVGSCTWIDSSAELGTGYCVPSSYNKTDYCSDCSAQSPLFLNAFCTSTVCDGLGACFATASQSSCSACSSSSSCYDFLSQNECTGGQEAAFLFGALVPSADTCGLGRCRWNSASSTCFKDGNADGTDDCVPFSTQPFQFGLCKKDTTPPVTTISPEVVLVNGASGIVTFRATDNNAPKNVFFCFDKTNTCMPNATSFVAYGAGGIVTLNLASAGLSSIYTGAGDYFVRYFSEDVFFNRENIRSKRFSADLEAPRFVFLNTSVRLNTSGSDITFTIILDEPSSCTDRLFSYNTGAVLSELPPQHNDSRVITYSRMADGLYRYEVNCTDGVGNKASGVLDLIGIDAVDFITILFPPPALQQTTFAFVMNTSDDSQCNLFDGASPIETLSTNDFFRHTSRQRTFTANTFFSNFRVKCTELATGRLREKIIPFAIDRLAPRTTIRITSAEGLVQAFNTTGWEATMNSNVSVVFACEDLPQNGFGCKETRHCLTSVGGTCVPVTSGPVPPLSNSTGICFFSVDRGNSNESLKCGSVAVTPRFGIALARPRFGFSDSPVFDLAVSTTVASDTCKWAARDFNFTSLVNPANVFTPVTPVLFEKINFTEIVPEFPIPNPTMLVSVRCNATTGRISPVEVFEVGWDPTPPVITSAFADPAQVIEGNSVRIVIQTDDRTVCRYGQVPTFDAMVGTFPGFAEHDFTTSHSTTIALSGNDDGRTHTYNISCMNRAENVSTVVPVAFRVDFSVGGAIIDKGPTGVFTNVSIILRAQTNRDAVCEFLDGTASVFRLFSTTGQVQHIQFLSNITEGSHTFPLRCTFVSSGVVRQDQITFTVDRTPPDLNAISDGNFSCSLNSVSVGFSATDALSSVTSYDFKITHRQTSQVISNGTATSSNPTISGLNLTAGTSYFVTAKARDAAGNVGGELSSDGFVAVSANATECRVALPPRVDITATVVREGVSVALQCSGDINCASLLYGLADARAECAATASFTGAVLVSEPQFFCYSATDGTGRALSGGQAIAVPDEDGDHITDPFDQCPDTPLGETVDDDGCSASQRVVDTDGDQLPDDWELQHDADDCPFDPREPDTDGDSVDDGEDDYDKDGDTNHDEYLARTDPCRALDTDGDGVADASDQCAGTSVVERTQVNARGCGPSQRDTDNDGMDDAFENLYCSGNCDPAADVDDDDLTNIEEYRLKSRYGTPSNPTRADTDGDGFGDGREVASGTNPLDATSKPAGLPVLPSVLVGLGGISALAGAAYLVYAQFAARQAVPLAAAPPVRVPAQRGAQLQRLHDVVDRRREERRRAEEERRRRLFGIFGPSTGVPPVKKEPLPALPELARIVKKEEKPTFERLAELAQKYVEEKGDIHEKLTADEKEVFQRLGKIAHGVEPEKLRAMLGQRKEEEIEHIFGELSRIVQDHGKTAKGKKK